MKKSIQQSLDDDYEKRKREEFINYFIKKTKLTAPSSMVSRYLDKLTEEQVKKDKNLDKDKFRDQSINAAEYNVKWFIIKDLLIQKADISINDDDINKEIDKIVSESNEEEKRVREFFSDDNNKNSLATNLVNEKLFSHIDQYATIKDSEKSTSELRGPK